MSFQSPVAHLPSLPSQRREIGSAFTTTPKLPSLESTEEARKSYLFQKNLAEREFPTELSQGLKPSEAFALLKAAKTKLEIGLIELRNNLIPRTDLSDLLIEGYTLIDRFCNLKPAEQKAAYSTLVYWLDKFDRLVVTKKNSFPKDVSEKDLPRLYQSAEKQVRTRLAAILDELAPKNEKGTLLKQGYLLLPIICKVEEIPVGSMYRIDGKVWNIYNLYPLIASGWSVSMLCKT